MNNSLNGLLLKKSVHGLPVPDVQLIEPGLGVYGGPEAGEQVVRHHHVPASVDQLIHSVGADIASSTQY